MPFLNLKNNKREKVSIYQIKIQVSVYSNGLIAVCICRTCDKIFHGYYFLLVLIRMLRGSLKKCLLIAGTLSICFYGMKKSQVILEVKSDQSHIIINNPPKNTTSFTTTPKVTAYNPPTFLDTIEMRVKKVEEFCETQPHKDARIGPLLVLKERNLVWCPVYKSGTSAWMTYLVHLSTKSATEKKTLIVKNPTSTISNIIEFLIINCHLLTISQNWVVRWLHKCQLQAGICG